jgi:predicted nucleic acid-binding protein
MQRQPFVTASVQALSRVTQSQQLQGYVSGHAVTNVFYILRRQVGSKTARELLSKLLQHLQVASVTDEIIRLALQNAINDFEDAVTSEAAKAINVEVIVTRNIADFGASSVPAVLPQAFLTMPLE